MKKRSPLWLLPVAEIVLLSISSSVVVVEAQEPLVLRFSPSGDTTECRRVFAVVDGDPIDEAGVFCLFLQDDNSELFTLSYSSSNGWLMGETFTWFGSSTSMIPMDNNGQPNVDQFPYVTEEMDDGGNGQNGKNNGKNNKQQDDDDGNGGDNGGDTGGDNGGSMMPVPVLSSSVALEIPLVDLGVLDCAIAGAGAQTTVLGLSMADLVNDNTNQDAMGWVDGVLPTDTSQGLWTLFNFTVECMDPVAGPMPPPDSGGGGLPDGSECDDNLDCASGGCALEGFCLLSNGESCGENEACGSGYCENFFCRPNPAGDSGNNGGGGGDDGGDGFDTSPPQADNYCDGSITDSSSPLAEEIVQRSAVAAQLTQALQTFIPGAGVPSTSLSVTEMSMFNDQTTMVGKVDGVCYGIFAPWEPDYTFGSSTVTLTSYEQTCQILDYAYNEYFTAERSIFELRLAQCASTCMGPAILPASLGVNQIVSVALDQNACPIVLAGHGLGGAVAAVGSMMILDLDPTVITMGAPRAISPNCPLMRDSERHYRHVNWAWISSMDTYLFDATPQLHPAGDGELVHYGQPVMLAPDNEPPMVSSLDDDTTRASMYSWDVSVDTMIPSQMDLYNSRISALSMSPCFPVPVIPAWDNGHWCDADYVCWSGRCRFFVTLEEGGGGAEQQLPENEDTMVTSTTSTSRSSGISIGVCGELQGAGAYCSAAKDCQSGICNAGICDGSGGGDDIANFPDTLAPDTGNNESGGGPTGPGGSCSPCTTDGDCQSGVCQFFEGIPGSGGTNVCAETTLGTMSDGCFCNPNDDLQCTSGRCESDTSGQLWICIAPVGPCQSCDEPTDCESGNCVDGVCGLADGGLPSECGGGGSDGGGNAPPLESCTFASCMSDADCISGFCRTVGTTSTCAEFGDGRMADGCPCHPVEPSSCTSGNCVRHDPMLYDVGTCQPETPDPAPFPSSDSTLCYNDNQCDSGSCTLKCSSNCGCACPFWSCD